MAVFVPGHLGGFVLEQIFVAVTVIIFGFIAANGKANGNYFNISKLGVVLFFILLEILYVASFFLSEARLLSGSVGIRDFFELSRYFIYFLFFFVVILTHPRDSSRMAGVLITAALAFSLFVAFLYLVPVPVISSFFENVIYAATRDDLSQISTGGRVRFTAPFPNPNYLAYFLCLTLGYLIFLGNGLSRLVLIGVALVLLFLTGSRTGWGVAALLFILLLIYHFQRILFSKGKFGSVVLIVAVVLAGFWMLTLNGLPTLTRITEVTSALRAGDIANIPSVAHRMQHNSFVWEAVSKSVFWGLGPSKYSLTTVIDNQYLMWITRQGVIGLAVILMGVSLAFYRMISVAPTTTHKYGVVCFFVVVFLFGMTGAFLNNFRLFLLTLFFGACILDSCLMPYPESLNQRKYS